MRHVNRHNYEYKMKHIKVLIAAYLFDWCNGDEESYAALCAGYEDSKRNGKRFLIIMLYYVKLGCLVHRLGGQRW